MDLSSLHVRLQGVLFLLRTLSVQQVYGSGPVFFQVVRVHGHSLLGVGRVVRTHALYVLSNYFRRFHVSVVSLGVCLSVYVRGVLYLFCHIVPRLFQGRVFPLLYNGLPIRSQYGVYYGRNYLGQRHSASTGQVCRGAILFPQYRRGRYYYRHLHR